MTRDNVLHFELYVMDLAEQSKCVTAADYERIAEQLHESVENAIVVGGWVEDDWFCKGGEREGEKDE